MMDEKKSVVAELQKRIEEIETCGVYQNYLKHFKPKGIYPKNQEETIRQMETELSCYNDFLALLGVSDSQKQETKQR